MTTEFPIRVHLRDTVTGFARVYETTGDLDDNGAFNDFQWSENSYACDHNRVLFLSDHGKAEGAPRDDEAVFNCVSRRIVIDKIERADTGEVVYTEAEPPQ